MNRNFASTLIITGTAAAALGLAALTSTAYADDITIDKTPFVSTKSRAEVRAEVMGNVEQLRMANGEWPGPMTLAPQASSLTRAQAQADYVSARREVNAFNAEDSGSSYIASHQPRRAVILAGSDR